MEHKDAKELLEAYVLGALDKEELDSLEVHLKSGCQACNDALMDLNDFVSRLALTIPPKHAPIKVKEKIMANIANYGSEPEIPTSKLRFAGWISAGIAALIALYLGIQTTKLKLIIRKHQEDYTSIQRDMDEHKQNHTRIKVENTKLKEDLKAAKTEIALGFDKMRKLREKNSDLKKDLVNMQKKILELRESPRTESKLMSNLKAEVARTKAEMMSLRKKLTETEEVTELIASPGTQFINLTGVDPHPHAFGKVVVDPIRGSAAVYVYRLPEPPDCMEYQVWVIRENQPTSAGVFKVGKDGSTVLKLDDLPDPESIASFSVTIEPTGGLPQPSGMMYLTGP